MRSVQVLCGTALFVSSGLLSAGTIRVMADPGTTVTIGFSLDGNNKYPTGNVPAGKTFVDIIVGDQNEEARIKGKIDVWKKKGGEDKYEQVKLTPPLTLASLEPFDVPTFAADMTPLVLVFDVAAATGLTFTVGSSFTVTNGMIAGLPGVLLLDFTGLSAPPGTVVDLTGASAYTGTASIVALDAVTAVPEPASVLLLLTGLTAFMGFRRPQKHLRDRRC